MKLFYPLVTSSITLTNNSNLFQTLIHQDVMQELWMFKTHQLYLVGLIIIVKMLIQLKDLVIMINSKNFKLRIRTSYKEVTSLPTIRITVFLFLDLGTLTCNTTLKPIQWNTLKLNFKKMIISHISIKYTITIMRCICLVITIFTL